MQGCDVLWCCVDYNVVAVVVMVVVILLSVLVHCPLLLSLGGK